MRGKYEKLRGPVKHVFASAIYLAYLWIMSLQQPEVIRNLKTVLSEGKRESLEIEGFRNAAVLVPLIGRKEGLTLLFTRRTNSVETHKGQISFPGGMVEEGDEDVIATALRETHEEVGIPQSAVQTLGVLDDIATPIGFIITPVVGFLSAPPTLIVNAHEVAEVFEVPVAFFSDPLSGRQEIREVEGRRYEIWHYDTGTHVIWGATAKIVRMLVDMVGTNRAGI